MIAKKKKPTKAEKEAEKKKQERLLRRLWTGNSGTSTRKGIELLPIVRAAIALADEGGLDAVSMRAVADAVGFPAMSLYSHVAGKEELSALMQDFVLAGLYDDGAPSGGPAGWRAGLTRVAEKNRALFRAHPWLLKLGGRPVLGPHTTQKYEVELRPLDGTGLGDVENDAALSLVLAHAAGASWTHTKQESPLTDHEWWDTVGPLLERYMPPNAYPLAGRVGEAASVAYGGLYDDDHAFSFGLDRILDGIWLLMGAPARPV